MRKLVPFVLIALAGCLGPGEDPIDQPGSGGSGPGNGSGGHASGGSPGSGGNGSGGAASGSGGQTGSGGQGGSGGSGSGGQGSGSASGTGGATASGGTTGSGGTGSGGKGLGGGGGRGGFTATGGASGSGGSGMGGGGGKGGASGVMGSGGTVAAVCTSNKTYTNGNGISMRPGNDCVSCHKFTVAGTIYPTLHEPNNCDGTAANGLKVVITGADGVTTTLTPDSTSGNFYSSTSIKTPFSAKVTNSAGGSRAMVSMQTKGNCNSCHTQNGANAAPGRIIAP